MADWLILELNDFLDVTYKDIVNAIITTFGYETEYFIPVHYEEMGSYTSVNTLMDGYVFIKNCDKVQESLINLREQRVFSKVLCKKGKLVTVDSRVIAGLKNKLKNIVRKKFALGAKVRILDGVFKNLIGEVIDIEDQGKRIVVRIKRVSREIIAPVPATLLEKVSVEDR